MLLSTTHDTIERHAQETGRHELAKELEQSQQLLAHLHERFRIAIDSAGIGVWDLDLIRDELIWDDSMYALYHVSKEDVSGAYEAWKRSVHHKDFARADGEVQTAIRGKTELRTEFRIVWPGGQVRHIRTCAQVTRDDDGTPRRMIGISRDITVQKKMEAEIRMLTSKDSLTDVYNRRQFDITAAEEWRRAKRYGLPLSLVILDVDHLTSINDKHGHDAGNAVLKELAHTCQSKLRSSDILFRMGGGRFSILMTHTHLENATPVVDRLRQSLEQLTVAIAQAQFSCTVSMGITAMRPKEDAVEAMLKRAEMAMYQAKANGRNRVNVIR